LPNSRPSGSGVISEHWPQAWPYGETVGSVIFSNDEIEVACDALWFVKSHRQVDCAQERLWDRLQPLRTGDFGGSAEAELDAGDTAAVVRALRFVSDAVALDEDEERLLQRLVFAEHLE